MKKKNYLLGYAMIALLSTQAQAQYTSDFEALPLPGANTYWSGSDQTGGFENGLLKFKNKFTQGDGYFYWSGCTYSNMKDTETVGLPNQFSSYAGGGAMKSEKYAVLGLGSSKKSIVYKPLAQRGIVKGMYVTNSTYAALDMKNGSMFSKKFGGTTGNDPDYFKLSIINYLEGKATDTIDVFLADFRAEDNSKDYILNTWQYVNTSVFGYSDSLSFHLKSSDTGDFGMNTPSYICLDNITIVPAPFAPPVGTKGSDAVSRDSAIVKSWATNVEVTRGYQNIETKSLGFATVGQAANAVGKAGANGVVSLGDGGSATVQFAKNIKNGAGADFVVFENSFNDKFLELAFVEVSSDGINFTRFSASSYTDTTVQVDGFGNVDARMINNLAGKYRANFGTPFDLEELKDAPNLNVNAITHVRIIDVVGSVNPMSSTRDNWGHIVNDPFPTPFASSGFDLAGVGVVNEDPLSATSRIAAHSIFNVYPNPVSKGGFLNFDTQKNEVTYSLYDASGIMIQSGIANGIETASINAGMYMLQLIANNESITTKFLVK